jgi:hypothetical protein
VGGMATGGVALANVLFLRDVWAYTLVGAGISALPSALTAALSARAVGRMGVRFGEVAVAAPGAICIMASMVWLRLLAHATPNYWLGYLPAAVLIGYGVAASFSMIAVAVVRGIGADELSLASATDRTFLQTGNAIGIAAVVAVLGNAKGPDGLKDFRGTWTVLAILAACCAVTIVAMGSTVRTPNSPIPNTTS